MRTFLGSALLAVSVVVGCGPDKAAQYRELNVVNRRIEVEHKKLQPLFDKVSQARMAQSERMQKVKMPYEQVLEKARRELKRADYPSLEAWNAAVHQETEPAREKMLLELKTDMEEAFADIDRANSAIDAQVKVLKELYAKRQAIALQLR